MRGNSIGSIVAGVVALIVLACLIFVAVIGFKAVANETTFTEEWNNVWGTETVQEENPDVTDEGQEEQTPSEDEEETETPVLTMSNTGYVIL